MVDPVLGAATGLGGWFVGGAVLPICGGFQRRRQQHSATAAHSALPVCEWPALGMPWGTASSMQPLLCALGDVGPALGAAAGLGSRWFVGLAVLRV